MKLNRFAKYAWSVLAYNLLVILWGAYVRASGSGAGCGSHWPLCNGQVVPQAPEIATIVEFSHRLSSGISLLLVAGLFVLAFRAYPKGHAVRLGATLSVVFIITEALVGAGLVLFQLVAENASIGRAVGISVHLVNTFLLVAALTLTAWWGSGGARLRLRGQGAVAPLLLIGCLSALLIGVSGAVTALGDTLFPASSLAEGLRQDFSPTAHILIRLRLFHPAIAVVVGIYLLLVAGVANVVRPSRHTGLFARALGLLFVVQMAAGVINVLLLAPIPMQLVHLLLADALWIALVLLTAAALAVDAPRRAGGVIPVGPGPMDPAPGQLTGARKEAQ